MFVKIGQVPVDAIRAFVIEFQVLMALPGICLLASLVTVGGGMLYFLFLTVRTNWSACPCVRGSLCVLQSKMWVWIVMCAMTAILSIHFALVRYWMRSGILDQVLQRHSGHPSLRKVQPATSSVRPEPEGTAPVHATSPAAQS